VNTVVYILAVATNLVCSWLLLRAYSRVKKQLLLWSGLCFAGLALSSAMVFVDLVMFPAVDLYLWRLGISAAAMGLLVYGLLLEQS
jgi:hypothetical protein